MQKWADDWRTMQTSVRPPALKYMDSEVVKIFNCEVRFSPIASTSYPSRCLPANDSMAFQLVDNAIVQANFFRKVPGEISVRLIKSKEQAIAILPLNEANRFSVCAEVREFILDTEEKSLPIESSWAIVARGDDWQFGDYRDLVGYQSELMVVSSDVEMLLKLKMLHGSS